MRDVYRVRWQDERASALSISRAWSTGPWEPPTSLTCGRGGTIDESFVYRDRCVCGLTLSPCVARLRFQARGWLTKIPPNNTFSQVKDLKCCCKRHEKGEECGSGWEAQLRRTSSHQSSASLYCVSSIRSHVTEAKCSGSTVCLPTAETTPRQVLCPLHCHSRRSLPTPLHVHDSSSRGVAKRCSAFGRQIAVVAHLAALLSATWSSCVCERCLRFGT